MKRHAVVAVAYVLVALAVFGAVLPAMGHSWIGLNADARQEVYWLDLVADALRHGHSPLVTTAIQAPGGVNLMWNPSMVLPGIVLAPLTLLAGPYASYNVLIIAAPVLSAWAAYAVLRRMVTSPPAAWVGGLVYGFSPALLAESLGHAQTAMAWFPPVVLLLLHEALVRRRWSLWRVGVLLGVASAVQLLTGEEMLLATGVAAACGAAILALQHGDRARDGARRLGMVLAIGAGAGIVLAVVPLAVQFLGPYRPSGRLVPGDVVVSDLGAFLVPSSRQLLRYPGLSADPWTLVTEDSGAYIGLPVMLLLVIVWDRLRRLAEPVRWAVPLTLLIGVLALGPHLHIGGTTTAVPLPWLALDRVPLLENLDPARLMVLAWLPIAVVAAVAVDRALRRAGRDRLVSCGLIALGLATLLPAAIPVTAVAAPAYFTSPDAATIPSGDTVLIAPLSDGAGLAALIWQAQAGLRWRMVDGNAYGQDHAVYFPPSALTDTLAELESGATVDTGPAAVATMRGDLRRLGVGTVIVSGGGHQEQELALLRQLLGMETYAGGGAFVWHKVAALIASP